MKPYDFHPEDILTLGPVPALTTPPVDIRRGYTLVRVAEVSGMPREHVAEHLGEFDGPGFKGAAHYCTTRALLYALVFLSDRGPRPRHPERAAWSAIHMGMAYRYPPAAELGDAHLWIAPGDPEEGDRITAVVPGLFQKESVRAEVVVGEVVARYGDLTAFVSVEDLWRLEALRRPENAKDLHAAYLRSFSGTGLVPRIRPRDRYGAATVPVDDLVRLGWPLETIRDLLGAPDQTTKAGAPAWDVRRVWVGLLSGERDVPVHPEVFGLAVTHLHQGQGRNCVSAALWVKGALRGDVLCLRDRPAGARDVVWAPSAGSAPGWAERRRVRDVVVALGGVEVVAGV